MATFKKIEETVFHDVLIEKFDTHLYFNAQCVQAREVRDDQSYSTLEIAGTLFRTSSKKIKVGTPIIMNIYTGKTISLWLRTKMDSNNLQQKIRIIDGMCMVKKEQFSEMLNLLLNYKEKLYLSFFGPEFFRGSSFMEQLSIGTSYEEAIEF